MNKFVDLNYGLLQIENISNQINTESICLDFILDNIEELNKVGEKLNEFKNSESFFATEIFNTIREEMSFEDMEKSHTSFFSKIYNFFKKMFLKIKSFISKIINVFISYFEHTKTEKYLRLLSRKDEILHSLKDKRVGETTIKIRSYDENRFLMCEKDFFSPRGMEIVRNYLEKGIKNIETKIKALENGKNNFKQKFKETLITGGVGIATSIVAVFSVAFYEAIGAGGIMSTAFSVVGGALTESIYMIVIPDKFNRYLTRKKTLTDMVRKVGVGKLAHSFIYGKSVVKENDIKLYNVINGLDFSILDKHFITSLSNYTKTLGDIISRCERCHAVLNEIETTIESNTNLYINNKKALMGVNAGVKKSTKSFKVLQNAISNMVVIAKDFIKEGIYLRNKFAKACELALSIKGE